MLQTAYLAKQRMKTLVAHVKVDSRSMKVESVFVLEIEKRSTNMESVHLARSSVANPAPWKMNMFV